jgi:hypothetical protein
MISAITNGLDFDVQGKVGPVTDVGANPFPLYQELTQ